MPKYKVTDSESGRTLILEGDSPPTEQELLEIFSNNPVEATAPTGGISPKTLDKETKEKVKNLPWYESLAQDLEQIRYNMAWGVAEGVTGLGTSIANLVKGFSSSGDMSYTTPDSRESQSIPNPMRQARENAPEGSLAANTSDSLSMPIVREVTQIAPVSGGLTLASKAPSVATAVTKIPKVLRAPSNIAASEFIAYPGDQENIAELISDTSLKNPVTDFLTKKDTDSELVGRAKNVVQGLAAASGVKLLGKSVKTTFKGIEKALSAGDSIYRPIKSRVEAISPRIANRLDGFEMEVNVLNNNYQARVVPFLESLQKFSKQDRVLFDRYTRNSELKKAGQILKKYDVEGKLPGVSRQFQDVRGVLDELHQLANDNGIEVAFRRDYLPRTVKDYEGLMKSLGAEPRKEIDKLLDEARNRKLLDIGEGVSDSQTVDLTEFERQQVIERYLNNTARLKGGPTFAKERVIEKVTPEMEKFYGSFENSLSRYISSSTYRVARNRFTGKSPGYKESSWQTIAAKLYEEKKLSADDLKELRKLVSTRMSGGETPVGKNLKLYRDIVYATHIGNPYSTMTQFGDMGLNLYRNGLIPTLKGLKRNVPLKTIGVDDVSAEFADASSMQKGLDFVMKLVGFKQLDQVLKEVNINGALAKAQGLIGKKGSKSYNDFIEEQRPYFGEETQSLVDALAKGDMGDENAKLYLYTQLAKTQPISLSEMPEHYLNSKNGRIFYFLKSFTIKQIELVRADILRKVASDNPKEVKEGFKNAARLAVYFGGGTTGINISKDFLLNRDVDIPEAAMDSFLQFTGMPRFVIQKTRREGLGYAVGSLIMPPIPVIGQGQVLFQGKLDKIPGEVVRNVPIIGKDLYWGSKAVDLTKFGLEKVGVDTDEIPMGAGEARETKRRIEEFKKSKKPAKPARPPKPIAPLGVN